MAKKEIGREDRMHFLVRTEIEFKDYRLNVDEPYSMEEIKILKRMARCFSHIAEDYQKKRKKTKFS
ncbi:hypothetical protein [Bacteroides sp.]